MDSLYPQACVKHLAIITELLFANMFYFISYKFSANNCILTNGGLFSLLLNKGISKVWGNPSAHAQ